MNSEKFIVTGATLLVIFIMFLSLVGQVLSVQRSTAVHTTGVVRNIGVSLYFVGFEIDSDFTYGTQHTGNYTSPWDRGGWTFTNPLVRFEPETTIVHGGATSAKLWLEDPTAPANPSQSHRLNLFHDWDPWVEHIWLEAWYYIPEDFPSATENLKSKIFILQSERLWTGPRQTGSYYFFNGPGIGMLQDLRSGRPTYHQYLFNLGRGRAGGPSLPDGGDAASDVYLSDQQMHWTPEAYVWDVPPEDRFLPPFGEWFKIKGHVWRNHADWQNGDKDTGIIEIWLTLPPNYEERLAHNSTCRTIGIDPAMIEEAGWVDNENGMGYVATGLALYPTPTSPPQHIFVDDVSLSSEGTFTS